MTAEEAQPPNPVETTARWKIFAAVLLLVLAGLLAYANSFHGPLVFDDAASITNNPTLRQGLAGALQPPANGETVTARPLLNLSFALNYAHGGEEVAGYHVVNLVIHLLAGLVLFGLVRRTLELPSLRERWGRASGMIAFAAALWWTLHPLQTESVTYVVQRAESLAGLFYLLTFYGLARAMDSTREKWWLALSATACLLGVFCKETLATAPLLALLYDRAFAAGSLAGALRQRAKYYAALAATWLPLAWLTWSAGGRGGSAGFGAGASVRDYALTQARAVALYLRLSLWPSPLVFDYGNGVVKSAGEVAPQLALITALLALTVYLLWKKPAAGFLGAWFFATLAPSSSFIPIATETMAEHRMYLALAAVVVTVALTVRKIADEWYFPLVALAVAVALGGTTYARNRDYAAATTLWSDTADKVPDNPRAHENYAAALMDEDDAYTALFESRRALALQPDYPEAENSAGQALARLNHPETAAPHFARAAMGLRLPREKALAYFNLGSALGQKGFFDEALTAYTKSEELLPDYAPTHNLRGYIFYRQGRYQAAVAEFEQALKLRPNFPQCEANLADARAKLGLGVPAP
ncbi:MAG TPA: tetratricopeptide repeat protein [Opitutales bacterium]|nr:tetratricopeptide repeat protein [Opitutales bacterium]